MKITDLQLNSFIKLYKQEFNKNIDKAEALKQATALISVVESTYKPMNKKEFEKYNK